MKRSNSKAMLTVTMAVVLAGCGIAPVVNTGSTERESVLPRQATNIPEHAERLRDAGIEPLNGQNIVYTLDQLEASLRRAFAGTRASIIRDTGRLLVRCPMDQVIDPESKTLHANFATKLNSIAEVLAQHPALFLEIGVHTDFSGGQRLNYRTSEIYANEISSYLLNRELPESHVLPVAFGESELLVKSGDAMERAANNRVEFLFIPLTAGP